MALNHPNNTAHSQERQPESFACYFNLGLDCRKKGDLQGAIEAWTQALSINPQNAHAYYYRGVTKADLQDYKGAIEDFEQAININPKYSNAHYQRDKVRKKLDASEAHLYYQQAKSRHKRGDKEGAIKYFQTAAKLFCENKRTEELSKWSPVELGQSNRKEAIHYLVHYLSSNSSYDEKRLTASAIQKLARNFPDIGELVLPHLLNKLSDPAPQVRKYVLKAINELELPGSVIPEIKAIAKNDIKVYNRDSAKSILRKFYNVIFIHTKLHDLLAEENWLEADQETYEVLHKAAGKQGNWLDIRCRDLWAVDQLWMEYSNGCFGFSVQTRIWQEMNQLWEKTGYIGRIPVWMKNSDYYLDEYLDASASEFEHQVGWGGELKANYYEQLNFKITAPKGHLPSYCYYRDVYHEALAWYLDSLSQKLTTYRNSVTDNNF